MEIGKPVVLGFKIERMLMDVVKHLSSSYSITLYNLISNNTFTSLKRSLTWTYVNQHH